MIHEKCCFAYNLLKQVHPVISYPVYSGIISYCDEQQDAVWITGFHMNTGIR